MPKHDIIHSLKMTGLFLMAGYLSVAQVPSKEASVGTASTVERGRQLFQTNCTACHNFLQKSIGPNLAEIPAGTSAGWLKKFIRNAPAVIEDGDKRAADLYAEYGVMMPAFPQLSDPDLESLVAYLNTKKAGTPSVTTESAFGPPINDLMPEKIASSGVALWLDELTTAPVTNAPPAISRINTMRTLKTGRETRLFIADLQGILYQIQGTKFNAMLDLREHFPDFINKPGFGTGFGSFAFHPLFAQNGLLYTAHAEKLTTVRADFGYADSIKVALQWVLTEWKIDNQLAAAFTGKHRELMRIDVVSPIHGMQEIAFNPLAAKGSPDFGLLYIGVGDGGATENGYYFLCADPRSVWGKLLRIDPLAMNSTNGQYGIPADNPRAGEQAAPNEVFCRGVRNPNRFSWSPDGKLLVADIGHHNVEELNWALKGADYGWPEREGPFLIDHRAKMDHVYNRPVDEKPGRYHYPIAWYDHDEGNAISGGYVYAGAKFSLLAQKYIFGDIAQGRVFYVDISQLKPGVQRPVQELVLYVNGRKTSLKALHKNRKPDLRIGEGPDHDLYFFTKTNGKVYKLTGCTPVR